jgi:hypothetical protein
MMDASKTEFDAGSRRDGQFRNLLDNMIDMRHELVRLAGLIDWKLFDEAFGGLYAEKGCHCCAMGTARVPLPT